MGNYKFILSGGGTGGHIYPAIAIANELGQRFPDAEFLFVGAKDRMEMQKVPEAGYKIIGLWISGLERKLSLKNLLFPVKLVQSMIRARKILKDYKPTAVIGTGGFASGPVLRVASGMGIPTLIQEQNSYAGITNKLLGKRVDRICVAYEGMEKFFPEEKIRYTGNPVRKMLVKGLEEKKEAYAHFKLHPETHCLLVLGGSLGAARINQLIEANLDFFKSKNVQVLWQCGSLYAETYKKHDGETVRVKQFIHRMDYAYAIADTVISRAGAGSVSELSLMGKPVIFIPSPHVAEDHQTKNAMAMVERGAALMMPEKELDEKFQDMFTGLLDDEKLREALGVNIKGMARPDATDKIADEIVDLIKENER